MRAILGSPSIQLDDLLTRICTKLELTDTQRVLAEGRYRTIGEWLGSKDSSLEKYNPTIYAQGSLRLDTTVKPLKYEEFDLDLVCELNNCIVQNSSTYICNRRIPKVAEKKCRCLQQCRKTNAS